MLKMTITYRCVILWMMQITCADDKHVCVTSQGFCVVGNIMVPHDVYGHYILFLVDTLASIMNDHDHLARISELCKPVHQIILTVEFSLELNPVRVYIYPP